MPSLLIAMVLFVGGHFLLSWLPIRQRLIGMIGDKGFAGVYSLIMIALLVWAGFAYAEARAETTVLLQAGGWANWLAVIATLPAFILIAAAYMTPNPTAVMGERLYDRDDPAPGVFRITRHPMMWGITLWALVHLLANGDTASLVLFGGLAALSFFGPIHIDHKRRALNPQGYDRLIQRTSFWPWGRGWVSPLVIGWSKVAMGTALWIALLALHPWLFGVAPVTSG